MTEKPTIEQYQKNIEEENFQAYKCVRCSAIIAPPSGSCYSCGGNEMDWAQVSGRATLISFTVIHVAPEEFQEEAPYVIAIMELEEGTRVTSRLLGYDPLKPEGIKTGTPHILTYEKGASGKTYLAFKPA